MEQNKGYLPPSQYKNIQSTPLITNSVPPISKNQNSLQDLENLKCALRSSSNFVTCPHCKNQAITKTDRKFSALNCICCLCTVGTCWLFFQACRGKDVNCYDADHYCNKCNSNLASYKAC
jgi:hypothetical protein